VIAAPIVLVARLVQASTSGFSSPPWARPLVALDALAFYLGRLVAPLRLGIDYGRSPDWLVANGPLWVTWIVAASAACALWFLRRKAPWAPVAGAVFVLGLLPTLGLAKFNFQYYSTAADHYVYLAMLGPALALGFGLSRLAPAPGTAVALVLLAPFGLLAHLQAFHWRESPALFEQTLKVNPASVAANVNLGLALMDRGNAAASRGSSDEAAAAYGEAERRFRAALATRPRDAEAHNDLANALAALGRYAEAIPEYLAAIEGQPANPVIHYNLAIALSRSGRDQDAAREYGEALRLNPASAEAHNNLAAVLLRLGDTGQAIVHYQAALRINPALEPARRGLADAQARGGGR
jgi:tetratricopeptide (TPR) repeat protein